MEEFLGWGLCCALAAPFPWSSTRPLCVCVCVCAPCGSNFSHVFIIGNERTNENRSSCALLLDHHAPPGVSKLWWDNESSGRGADGARVCVYRVCTFAQFISTFSH
uniref:Putative secreted protein n=1 Tax=Anopheles darlingi TaxID=43151 RepID=A0A2M4DGT2_ANODA